MNLNEMKKIAAARTKGKWEFKDDNIISEGYILASISWQMPTEDQDMKKYYDKFGTNTQHDNGAFIAMAANNWDKLMAVVDAAKNLVPRQNPKLGQEIVQGWEILYFALKDLEESDAT